MRVSVSDVLRVCRCSLDLYLIYSYVSIFHVYFDACIHIWCITCVKMLVKSVSDIFIYVYISCVFGCVYRTYIHTYIHTYIKPYIHTYIGATAQPRLSLRARRGERSRLLSDEHEGKHCQKSVYIYIYIYAYICVYMHIYIYVYIICICVCIYTYIYVYICM